MNWNIRHKLVPILLQKTMIQADFEPETVFPLWLLLRLNELDDVITKTYESTFLSAKFYFLMVTVLLSYKMSLIHFKV